MPLCSWFALGNVRSWSKNEAESPISIFSRCFTPWDAWGFWVSVFPKKRSVHQGQVWNRRKVARWHGKTWWGIFAALMCDGQLSVREEDGGHDGCSLVFHKHLKYIHWISWLRWTQDVQCLSSRWSNSVPCLQSLSSMWVVNAGHLKPITPDRFRGIGLNRSWTQPIPPWTQGASVKCKDVFFPLKRSYRTF